MIGVAWNCCGLGQSTTAWSLRELVSSHRPDLVFLSEVKLQHVSRIKRIVQKIGFPSFELVPTINKVGSLLLMWKGNLNVIVVVKSESFINAMVNDDIFLNPWMLTLVYCPPILSLRTKFLDNLHDIRYSFNGDWLIMGDFNMVLLSTDKLGGNPVESSSRNGFRSFLDDHCLIDLGIKWFAYTWNNSRSGVANIQERLDWAFANESWRINYLNATITHLQALQSNHKPLLFQMNPNPSTLPWPFKVESKWIAHPDTSLIIHFAWNKSQSFLARIKNTKTAFKIWNRRVFGNVQQRIKALKGIKGIIPFYN